TSRFALPATLMLALAAAAFVCRMRTTWPVRQIAFAGVAVFVLVSALPAVATRLYTAQNLAMKEIEWERDFVLRRPAGPRLFLSNKSAIPWILWQIPSLDLVAAKKRGDQIRYHLSQGTFREVLVTQALRPTSPEGRFGLDPEDELPPTFHLETLAIKRFGGRMERLSRIVSVDPEPPAPAAKPAS
ncbi:MAG TPA: hypothetical protein PLB90_01840, partial [Opitutaceae bacterium]|nr:hypothetical protein [Opitutaceae bacterium]